MMNCVFCNLEPDRVLDQNVGGVIIRDAYPISSGHTLIIPKRHVESFFDLAKVERDAIFSLLDLGKRNRDTEYSPAGYNIGINDGTAAGQTVSHMHLHLIPRYKGDCDDPRGGVRWVIPDKAVYWNDEVDSPAGDDS